MEKTKSIIPLLLVLLLVHIEAYAGVITKSFYVPVVKGVYEEQGEEEPDGLIEEEPEAEEQETEIATPMDSSVFVIVSEPIQIDVFVDEIEPETGVIEEETEPEPEELEEITGE